VPESPERDHSLVTSALPLSARDGSIRVVVAATHPMLRTALGFVVESDPSLVLAGSAGDAAGALRCAGECHPDVVLIDYGLARPGFDATISDLRSLGPDVAVLVTGMDGDTAYVSASLDAGAAGFVRSDSTPDELLAAIRRATFRAPGALSRRVALTR
jgi:DNA-binding NarL/FixJ family response regulator